MMLLENFIKCFMAFWLVMAAVLVFSAFNHNPDHSDMEFTVPDGEILL